MQEPRYTDTLSVHDEIQLPRYSNSVPASAPKVAKLRRQSQAEARGMSLGDKAEDSQFRQQQQQDKRKEEGRVGEEEEEKEGQEEGEEKNVSVINAASTSTTTSSSIIIRPSGSITKNLPASPKVKSKVGF